MKVELADKTRVLLKDLMQDFGLPDDEAHRNLLCGLSLNLGLIQLATFKGAFQSLIEETNVDVLENHEPAEIELPVPTVCDHCGVNTVTRGDGAIVCNCRVWRKAK